MKLENIDFKESLEQLVQSVENYLDSPSNKRLSLFHVFQSLKCAKNLLALSKAIQNESEST